VPTWLLACVCSPPDKSPVVQSTSLLCPTVEALGPARTCQCETSHAYHAHCGLLQDCPVVSASKCCAVSRCVPQVHLDRLQRVRWRVAIRAAAWAGHVCVEDWRALRRRMEGRPTGCIGCCIMPWGALFLTRRVSCLQSNTATAMCRQFGDPFCSDEIASKEQNSVLPSTP
jgi:hypothetical protein